MSKMTNKAIIKNNKKNNILFLIKQIIKNNENVEYFIDKLIRDKKMIDNLKYIFTEEEYNTVLSYIAILNSYHLTLKSLTDKRKKYKNREYIFINNLFLIAKFEEELFNILYKRAKFLYEEFN